jgi:hypothetical protein
MIVRAHRPSVSGSFYQFDVGVSSLLYIMKMKKLDSFLKESIRMHPLAQGFL